MVMSEGEGQVTVIYITNHRESQRDDFRRDVWQGRSVPMGQGTLVLLAQNARQFDAVEARWRGSIEGRGDGLARAP